MNVYADIPLISHVSTMLTDMMGDDFDPDTFWNTLDGETDAMDLIGRILEQRMEAKTLEEATKNAASMLSARAKRFSDKQAALTKALGAILDATGQQKVTHALATVSRTKPRVSANVTCEEDIPSQLTVTTVKPDLKAIKAQLDAGEEVPGAELVAGEPGVMVRVK
ncbi:siphovirus Gp157 family protein [Ruegeria sp. HKCCD6109]|uniref:siphovirus Gp157 family protein n=1 Tax=Ruegeria sp. HKCCD6109 TaxID=2683017 RepID=UPI001490E908|nr:siphovirus Gp157 family protein [Ruegeria sp. HKCCD6109]NOD65781.1 hypothetical protein [Ruegeria sp. HKCCD6109]